MEIPTSEITVKLACGHIVSYDKFKQPCAECAKQGDVYAHIIGELVDSAHKNKLELYNLINRKSFGCLAELVEESGKLVLTIHDKIKKDNYKLTNDQVSDIHKKLSEKIDVFETLVKNGKSAIRAIIDKEYYAKYFDSLGRLRSKTALFFAKKWVKTSIIVLTVILSGALLPLI